jgi:hypothetical protein
MVTATRPLGAGATCTASGTGSINGHRHHPRGQERGLATGDATIRPATTSLINTATVAGAARRDDRSHVRQQRAATATPTTAPRAGDLPNTKSLYARRPTRRADRDPRSVANAGPSDVSSAAVVDTLPAMVTGAT